MNPLPVHHSSPSKGSSSLQPALFVRELRFGYPGSGFELFLESFQLGRGETLLVSGPSGAGKTTLLRLLGGLLFPRSGTIQHHVGESRHELTPATAANWRLRHAGLVFQDFALLDYLSVRDNALLPLRFQNTPHESWDAARNRLPELAQRLDLHPLLERPAARLSQGEKQRVAVLRALVTKPSIVLADEPTSSLDRTRRDQTMALLEEHCRHSGAPLVLVTHDPELTERFPRRLDVGTLHRPHS